MENIGHNIYLFNHIATTIAATHIQLQLPHMYHHHTVQVEYLCQWLERKAPPVQVAVSHNHHVFKWSICAS